MKLTRLELSGFKSFADTVPLPFEDGVTAIVGPNGCGKSNISDAVRWVLGEQRVKMLRGARMDEVIFQGAARRRPVNIAEVALYLDNSDNTLPLAYNEVVVTRRLSRNGQSDYLVNGTGVRLRDVHDLLRGTGLGSDVGVVIEAQMIDRLLSDRPDERRSLFEEAAGIGLYRDRKSSTERRLERTQEDLQRLDDLISEVQTQVRSLARQRGKAERQEAFMAERFAIVMTLARREFARIDEQEASRRARQTELRVQIPEIRTQVVELEKQREASVQARASAEARRTQLERNLSDTRIEIEHLDGDLNLAAERLENAAARRTRAIQERQEADERAVRGERERAVAAAERAAAEEARHSVQMELGLRSATEEEVRTRLTAQRSLVRETEEARQRQAEILRTLVGESAAIEHELDTLHRQSAEAETHRERAIAAAATARQAQEAARTTLAARQRDAQASAGELERLRHQLAAAREHEKAVLVERRTTEEKLAQMTARRDALRELERQREGLAPAARALLSARAEFEEGAILGPLSDYVATSSSDARVAERLLAEWLNAVLVRDSETVQAVAEWHATTQPGPLVLLPVQPGPDGAPATAAARELGLRVNAPAEAWVETLLAGSALLDPGGQAIRRAHGAVYLAAVDVAGPLSRRAELEALERDLGVAQRRLEELTTAASRAADTRADLERSLEAASATADASRLALREAQAAADDANRHVHRTERESAEADQGSRRIKERLAEQSRRLEEIQGKFSAAGAEHSRLGDLLEARRAELAELEAAQEAAREHRVHWQVEEAQVTAREDAARELEHRATEGLEAARREREALDAEIKRIEEDTKELAAKRTAWEDTLADRRVTVQQLSTAAEEAERAVLAADARTAEVEEAIARARESLDQLGEEAHGIELELTQSAGRRQALVERLEAEWHRSLDELLGAAPSIEGDTESLTDEAERLAQALDALGPVNPLAAQEHAEELKRLSFLQEQRDDLVEARKSLLQALHEIDETARTMFVETFTQVREHFQTVFHTLFEGGECDVRLEDENDPLSSAIDIFAAPRGKRIQRIHLLSSGERALVALSLLFSIYLTKPAPFCLLDEVDAPLDDANVTRFVRLLDEFKSQTQFIVITHNPRTMQVADAVYGVTMQEPGVSTIVGVRLGAREAVAS